MQDRPQQRSLRSAPGIRWVRDDERVIVVDGVHNRVRHLRGLQASVWEWMALGYTPSRIIRLLGAVFNVPKAEAEEHFRSIVEAWLRDRLMVANAEGGGG